MFDFLSCHHIVQEFNSSSEEKLSWLSSSQVKSKSPKLSYNIIDVNFPYKGLID